MTLKQRILDDIKAAMRAREAERLGAIRLLAAAIKQREVDERIEADDVLIVTVVEKLLKQRRDSIEQFDRAGRTDLADKERAEVAVLEAYLPERLSAAEVEALIAQAIAACGATGPAAMGKVIAWLKPHLAGRADMAVVSAQVKARLVG